MKQMIFALLVLFFATTAFAQKVKLTKDGNYEAVLSPIEKDSALKPTGKTYTDRKGIVFPVYLTASGRPVVRRVSKTTGRTYNAYLKVQAQVN